MSGLDIDLAGATAELEGAGGLGESNLRSTPQEPTNVAPPEAGAVEPGATPGASSPPVEDTSFTGVDPSTLPPELQPIYKSMQADYTRKQQEAAPWRNLGEQLGVTDQSEIVAAWELHQTLQNQDNWKQLYNELGEHFGTQEVPEEPKATEFPDLNQLDPDEFGGPLKDYLTSLKTEFDDMKSTWQKEKQTAEFDRQRMAILGEMQRQETVIKQSHPDYTDEDIQAIYELSPAFEGNLMKAQERYEAVMQQRLERYLASKQAPAGTGPIPGIGNLSTVPEEEVSLDLDVAHKQAMAALAQLEGAVQ